MRSVGFLLSYMLITSSVRVGDPELLLRAARFAAGYVRLVGQELAPSKCVLLSPSKVVRGEMRSWVLSDGGDKMGSELGSEGLGWDTKIRLRGCGLLLSS